MESTQESTTWYEWIDYDTFDLPAALRFSVATGALEIWLTPIDGSECNDPPDLIDDSGNWLIDPGNPDGSWVLIEDCGDSGALLARRMQLILTKHWQLLYEVDQQAVKAGVVAKWDEWQHLICRIRSGEHGAWWRVDGCGYTNDPAEAWWLPAKDAFERTSHCGPEKLIKFELMPSLRPLST